jgi:hypothetical protein
LRVYNLKEQGTEYAKNLRIIAFVMLALSLVSAESSAPADLIAAQIVDKNVAACGGLQAWRAVNTQVYQGKMGCRRNQRASLPMPTSHSPEPGSLPQRRAEETQLPFLMETPQDSHRVAI